MLPFKVGSIVEAEFLFNTAPRLNNSISNSIALAFVRKITKKDKMDCFSIEICLLNDRKFDRIQEGNSEKIKKSYSIETRCFCKTQEI